jgi:hypothetical protein
MTRPTIAPAVAAALTAQVPARLIKKLDADPGLAGRWTWAAQADGWTVQTDKGDTVTSAAVIRAPGDIRCSCLLQPRCLHIAAVVAVLEPTEPTDAPDSGDERAAAPSVPGRIAAEPRAAPSAEARRAFTVCAELLATGAEAAGAFVQAELLRAIHACRGAGLHRLAAAQTRMLRSIRDLRADRPEFSLRVLTGDLREALAVAWALAAGDAIAGLVGTARRDYEPIGNLHLRGLCSEAVVTRSGYAGTVTYLLDDRGAIYTRSDVAPGDASRAVAAYNAAAGIGDAVLSHRELSRAGLFVSDATASADGRLGAGQRVRAVRASEPSRWDHPLLEARWAAPLADQLAAVAAHDGTPDELRPAGWDLVFVEGAIQAGRPPQLAVAGRALEVALSLSDRALAARDNLAGLATAHDLRVRVIARARLASAGQLELLALGPAPGETRLALPEAWHGRANLHYDRLSIAPAAAAVAAAPRPVASPIAGDDDLLEPLRRRIERAVLGGLGTLPVHALAEIERDAAALADRALGGAADALRDLGALAHTATRAMTGARRTVDRTGFAQVWLRAALYDDAARRRLHVARW